MVMDASELLYYISLSRAWEKVIPLRFKRGYRINLYSIIYCQMLFSYPRCNIMNGKMNEWNNMTEFLMYVLPIYSGHKFPRKVVKNLLDNS